MKLKKAVSFIIAITVIITITGCSNKNNSTPINSNTPPSSNSSYDRGYLEIDENETKNMQKMTCSREGQGQDGAEVKLNYTLFYQDDYLQILHSKEQVISENKDILDEYQTAYINIYKHYETLEYYETSIVREENSVTNDTVINYSKLDTNKLLEIEGEEDNIIKDGKVKLEDWLEFAKQFGTECK